MFDHVYFFIYVWWSSDTWQDLEIKVSLEKFHQKDEKQVTYFSLFSKTEANFRQDLHIQFPLFSFKSWNDREKPSFLQQTAICFSSL